MSILIQGMEMPKDEEILCINIYPDGKVCINLDLKCKRIANAFPCPAAWEAKMRRSDEWLKKCDPECDQKSVFPKCHMCDVALEYRQAIKFEDEKRGNGE